MSFALGFAGKVSMSMWTIRKTRRRPSITNTTIRAKSIRTGTIPITPPFPPLGLPEVGDKKSEPVELGARDVYTADATIKLPDGFSVEIPGPMHEVTDFAEFTSAYAVKDSVLTAHRELKIKETKAPADKYQRFSRRWRAIWGNTFSFHTEGCRAMQRSRHSIRGRIH